MPFHHSGRLAQRGRQLEKIRKFLGQVQDHWPDLVPAKSQPLTDGLLMHILQSVLLESGLNQYIHSQESSFTDAWETFLFAVENNKLDEVLEMLMLTQYRVLTSLMLYPLRYHEEALADWLYADEAWGLLYAVLAIEISDYGWYMGEEWESINFRPAHVLAGALQPLLAVEKGIAAVLESGESAPLPALMYGLALRYGVPEENDPFIGHMYVQDEEITIGWDEIPDLLRNWRRWQLLEKQVSHEAYPLTPAWLFGQASQCLETFGESHE